MTRGDWVLVGLIMIILVLVIGLVVTAKPTRELQANAVDNALFFKNHKSGLCFARIRTSYTEVPCDKVNALLINR